MIDRNQHNIVKQYSYKKEMDEGERVGSEISPKEDEKPCQSEGGNFLSLPLFKNKWLPQVIHMLFFSNRRQKW